MQAIERQAQRTIGLVSHAVGEHCVPLYITRFMVRVWFRAKLQASIEGTRNGMPRMAVISFWAMRVLPLRAPHVKR
jgi:hypothetical protein